MRRFERIHDVVEPVEEYRSGGYHPVHLRDVFNNRYEVIGKLAFGQFSTVWLASDQELHRTVALKILKSSASKDNEELAILLRLSHPTVDHPGKKHVIELLDHFSHEGPNGTHLCLVFPVMLSDGESMTVTRRSHGVKYVQTIAKQILLGLDFLHGQGIIHCDLQPANIMFSLVSPPNNDFLQPPEFSPVRWLEGVEIDNSAPKYLIATQRGRGTLDNAAYSTLLVKIGDMGGAIHSQQCDLPVTPKALRAPELIRQDI